MPGRRCPEGGEKGGALSGGGAPGPALALRAAVSVDPSGLSTERQTRCHIDVARAYAQRRQVDDAVTALMKARQLSPEMARAVP